MRACDERVPWRCLTLAAVAVIVAVTLAGCGGALPTTSTVTHEAPRKPWTSLMWREDAALQRADGEVAKAEADEYFATKEEAAGR